MRRDIHAGIRVELDFRNSNNRSGTPMKTRVIGLIATAGLCMTALPARAQKEKDVQEVIQRFQKDDAGMQAWFKDAYGYAVFPSVGKGAVVVGGAHGDGLVYEQGKLIGKASLTAVTVGAQAGGQSFSEVIFFKDKTALDDFTRGNFEFAGGLSAVALKEGASKDLAYNKGVAVMTATKGGLMAEASIGGQKFKFEKLKT
jgi:lipid-binding SYLF domain-containing protein